MTKVISFFNDREDKLERLNFCKIAVALANSRLKTLVVDANDNDCETSKILLQTNMKKGVFPKIDSCAFSRKRDKDALQKIQQNKNNDDLFNSLAGHFGFSQDKKNLDRGLVCQKTDFENLFLLPGNSNIFLFKYTMYAALKYFRGIPVLNNLVYIFSKVIENTVAANDFDIVLIDVPFKKIFSIIEFSSVSFSFLMASDYFFLPLSLKCPPSDSFKMIDQFISFSKEFLTFVTCVNIYKTYPRFAGFLSCNAIPNSTYGNGTEFPEDFNQKEYFIKNLQEEFCKKRDEVLLPNLNMHDMVISNEEFDRCFADIPTFSRFLLSSIFHKPEYQSNLFLEKVAKGISCLGQPFIKFLNYEKNK